MGAPGGRLASNLAPTWRPRCFQKASGERLRGVWEASWNQKAPKNRPEPLQTSNLDPWTSILDPILMHVGNDFEHFLDIIFVHF